MLTLGKFAIRRLLRWFGFCLYHAGLARLIINSSHRPRVVLYHAIENKPNSFTEGLGITVSPRTFDLHLDYYQRYYSVLGMTEYLQKQTVHQRPALLITFDDGYASVMDNALPLLEARGMRATVYLIGNAVRGRMIWVNRLNQAMNVSPVQTREILAAYPQLNGLGRRQIIRHIQMHFEPAQITRLISRLESTVPKLSSESVKLFSTPADIRQMQNRGVEFGFHTNDHWNLGRCKDSELLATLCTDGIEDLLTSRTFAYPFGYFATSAIGHLSRQGYRQLLTVCSDIGHFSALHMGRTEVFESTCAGMFARLEIEEPTIGLMRHLLQRSRMLVSMLHGKKPLAHSS